MVVVHFLALASEIWILLLNFMSNFVDIRRLYAYNIIVVNLSILYDVME